MKKQIILDEQDINEFHEDAKHLRWVMTEWCACMAKEET